MKRDRKVDILKELRNKNVPVDVHWELTNRCNENCIHCLRDNRKVRELTLKEIKDIMLQLKKEGCFTLTFSGGEPFLRKDFRDILEFAYQQQFKVKILTNGTLINQKYIGLLKKIKPIFIQLSLYGASSQMHDSITQVKGSFKKTMKAIRLLEEHQITVKIMVMCLNRNFPELLALKRMAKKRKWNIVFDFQIFPTYLKKKAPIHLRTTDEQIAFARRKKILTWPCDLKPQDRKKRPPVSLFNYTPSISVQGDLHPSVLMRIKLGNLRKSSFHDIWHNSAKVRRLRSISEKQFDCFYCKYYTFCCRVPEMAYLEQGNFLVKSKEICRINNLVQKSKVERLNKS